MMQCIYTSVMRRLYQYGSYTLPCLLPIIWLPHQVPCRPLDNPHHLWLCWKSSLQPWPIWQWPSPHTSTAISIPGSILPECISLPRLGHLPLGTASTPTQTPSSPTAQLPVHQRSNTLPSVIVRDHFWVLVSNNNHCSCQVKESPFRSTIGLHHLQIGLTAPSIATTQIWNTVQGGRRAYVLLFGFV